MSAFLQMCSSGILTSPLSLAENEGVFGLLDRIEPFGEGFDGKVEGHVAKLPAGQDGRSGGGCGRP